MEISPFLIPIVAITGFFVTVIVTVLCLTIAKTTRFTRTLAFKQQMVEAGMSPHEIEQVLNSGTSSSEVCRKPPRIAGKVA